MTFQQGIMMMRMECERCQGSGQIISSPCTTCSGKGVETVKAKEEIKFPRGIDNGATLKFRGKGHISGDLIVQVVVKSHPFFKR
jgi:molecular chaperone DnaJ